MSIDLSIAPIIVSRHTLGVAPEARLLCLDDIPALLDLELDKWDHHQAASAADMAARMSAYPLLAIGAFDPCSGRALASLFLKPIAPQDALRARCWQDFVDSVPSRDTRCLFGISLSGRDDGGVDAIEAFVWPHLARHGWQSVVMGSPIPGWQRWSEENPGGTVEAYVARRRSDGLPCDPQLRYYHRRGFQEVLGVKPGYFPHARSHDHGVVLRCEVARQAAPVLQQRSREAVAEAPSA